MLCQINLQCCRVRSPAPTHTILVQSFSGHEQKSHNILPPFKKPSDLALRGLNFTLAGALGENKYIVPLTTARQKLCNGNKGAAAAGSRLHIPV